MQHQVSPTRVIAEVARINSAADNKFALLKQSGRIEESHPIYPTSRNQLLKHLNVARRTITRILFDASKNPTQKRTVRRLWQR